GITADPARDVLQAATGLQQIRLMEEGDVLSCAKSVPCLRQVVGVDREAVDAEALAGGHCPPRERLVEKGDERFRQTTGERAQAVAESGTEDEGLVHAACFDGADGAIQARIIHSPPALPSTIRKRAACGGRGSSGAARSSGPCRRR